MWSINDIGKLNKQINWLRDQYKCLRKDFDTNIDQNNKIRSIDISFNPSFEGTIEDVINSNSFEVSEREIIVFNLWDYNNRIDYRYIFKLGKGKYGVGGDPITMNDFEDFSTPFVEKRTNLVINQSSYTLQASDKDKFLMLFAPCTITVPSGLPEGTEFQGIQISGSDTQVLTFQGSGIILNHPSVFQNKTENVNCYWGIRLSSSRAYLTGTLKLA